MVCLTLILQYLRYLSTGKKSEVKIALSSKIWFFHLKPLLEVEQASTRTDESSKEKLVVQTTHTSYVNNILI